jgi:hypothetical protein
MGAGARRGLIVLASGAMIDRYKFTNLVSNVLQGCHLGYSIAAYEGKRLIR